VDPARPLVVACLAPDGADAAAAAPVVDVLDEEARSETRRQCDGRREGAQRGGHRALLPDAADPRRRSQRCHHGRGRLRSSTNIVVLLSVRGPDFWLFDEGEPDAHAVVMRYDMQGQWLGADLVEDSSEVRELADRFHAVAADAVPLNEFLVSVVG
jgi:hypothetical protein